MSRRKLSKRDYVSLNKGRTITTYPPNGGRARVKTSGPGQPKGRRRK